MGVNARDCRMETEDGLFSKRRSAGRMRREFADAGRRPSLCWPFVRSCLVWSSAIKFRQRSDSAVTCRLPDDHRLHLHSLCSHVCHKLCRSPLPPSPLNHRQNVPHRPSHGRVRSLPLFPRNSVAHNAPSVPQLRASDRRIPVRGHCDSIELDP